MRYPAGHKEEVRVRLVTAAGHALRRAGLDGVSIPALMKKAGLTHGGFYAHFDDKDDAVAAAVMAAADETAARVFGPAASVEALLAVYCSPEHVARPGDGCVVAALGGEGRRQGPKVRRAFAYAARGLLRLVEQKLAPVAAGEEEEEDTDAGLSDEALALCSRMVGAVVLARLVDDAALRDRLLATAQQRH